MVSVEGSTSSDACTRSRSNNHVKNDSNMSGDETILLEDPPSSEYFLVGGSSQGSVQEEAEEVVSKNQDQDDSSKGNEIGMGDKKPSSGASINSQIKQKEMKLEGRQTDNDSFQDNISITSMSRSSSLNDVPSMMKPFNAMSRIEKGLGTRSQSLEVESNTPEFHRELGPRSQSEVPSSGIVRVQSHDRLSDVGSPGETTMESWPSFQPTASNRTILKRRSSLSSTLGSQDMALLNSSKSSLTSIKNSSHRNDNAVLELQSLLVEPPSNVTRRSEEILATEPGMTVNQLRFFNNSNTDAALIGRERERETLQRCFRRAQTLQTRELVLISGYSGTGKTALAMTLQKETIPSQSKDERTRGALRILGKFDLFMRYEPYAGFIVACRELCNELLALPKSSAQHLRNISQQMHRQLEPENLSILAKMIPELQQILYAAAMSTSLTKTAGAVESNIRSHHQSSAMKRRSSFKAARNHGQALYNPNNQHEQQPLAKSMNASASPTPTALGGSSSIVVDVENYLSGVYVDDPGEDDCYSDDEGGDKHTSFHLSGLQEAKKRIAYCFSQFFQIVCQSYSCLIVQLDDLQWADSGSLDLIQTLLTDTSLRKFMIVGCYRSNEVQNNLNGEKNRVVVHPVNQMIVHLASMSASDSSSNTDEAGEQSSGSHKKKSSQRRRATLANMPVKPPKQTTEGGNSNSNNFYLTRIPVGNLHEHQVLEILMDVLSMTEEKTMELAGLANICFRKTHGNAFFLIQFLLHLQQENMLEYNFGLMKWIWCDESEIESRTASTANVVDLVKSKMAALPDPNVIQLLTILACLGSSFQKDIVQLVWESYWIEKQLEEDGEAGDVPPVESLLASATTEGYLERLSAGRNTVIDEEKGASTSSSSISLTPKPSPCSSYHFVHDNIQEAALSLCDPTSLPKLKSTLGKILTYELDCCENEQQRRTLESYLFTAVNLLNEGLPPETLDEQLDLAEMNLRAANRAIAFSGYNSASTYLSEGIDLLPPDRERWTDEYYPLSLEMYSSSVEVHGYLGNIDIMQMYCDEVLAQRHRPLVDKFRVYNVLQVSMFNHSKENEAIDLGLSLLKRLGCRFPSRKTGISVWTHAGIKRIKGRVESKSFERELANLPRIKDPAQLQSMHLLDKTSLYCFFSRAEMFPMLMLKMVQQTIKHGLCEYSLPAFANLGLLLAGMVEDYEAASKVADLTVKMMEQIPCRNTKARTILLLHWAVLPWSRPLRSLLNPFLKGYREGLATGDTESALWCIHNYIMFGLLCGRNLVLLDNDSNTYLKHIMALEQHKIAKYTKMLRQMILNFRGLDISPTHFYSESNSEEDLTETISTTHVDPVSGLADDEFNDEPLMWHALKCYQNRMYTIFGEHDRSAQLSIDRGDEFLRSFGGNCLHMGDAFHRALSLYAMARVRQEPIDVDRPASKMCVPYASAASTRGADAKMFKQLAKQHHSTIKHWLKKGNLNVIHYDRILDAENAAMRRRDSEAKQLYQNAIVMAAKSGFVQDAGLACERFAEFLLHDIEDEENALFRLEQAIRFYTEWGSIFKAKMIKAKHPSLFPRSKEIDYTQV